MVAMQEEITKSAGKLKINMSKNVSQISIDHEIVLQAVHSLP